MVKCIRGLENVARLRTYKQYRPVTAVSEDPRAWWLYAICCHFPDHQPDFCRPKPTWDKCLERARENVRYVKLYTKILTTPTLALTPDSKKTKDSVEWDRNYEELKALREVIFLLLPSIGAWLTSSSRLQLDRCPSWIIIRIQTHRLGVAYCLVGFPSGSVGIRPPRLRMDHLRLLPAQLLWMEKFLKL